MRTLTLTLISDDGKLVSTAKLVIDRAFLLNPSYLMDCLDELHRNLDILERDGPWKPQHIEDPPFPEEDYKRHVEQSEKTPPLKEL